VSARRALAAVLSRLPVRTVLHPINGEVAWARDSDWLSGGPVLDARVEDRAALVRGRVDVVVHIPEIRISRVDLPGVRVRDARRVAQRRREDLQGEGSSALHVSSLVRATPAGSALWLISGPVEACAEIDAELGARGIRAERLLPLSLALGALVRLLPKPEGKGLTAIVWVEAEWSHCVVADSEGWLFDRQIPLKLGFDAALGETPANAVAWEEEEHQFIEHVTVELDRTFAYVERNLALGQVGRICVCGPLIGLESLEQALVANQSLAVTRLGARPLPGLGWAPHPAAAVALGGVALGGSVAEATLLPRHLAAPRLRARARQRLVRAAVAASAFGMLALACAVWNVATVSASVSRLRAEAKRWEGERAGLAQLATERERAQRVLDARATLTRAEPPWSALLVVLGGLMPEKLFVSHLALAREPTGWRMEIWLDSEGMGESETAEAAASLRGRLAALSLFRVIELEPERSQGAALETQYRIATWVAAAESRNPLDGE